jgi:hypothetical protein
VSCSGAMAPDGCGSRLLSIVHLICEGLLQRIDSGAEDAV